MLVRLFGLFGIILGAAYLNQGVGYIDRLRFALAQRVSEDFITYALIISWDLQFGTLLIVAAVGLLFISEWARVMWLGLLPAVMLVHFFMIAVNLVYRGRISTSYLIWTAIVLTVTAMSWWYMTQDRIRVRFAGQKEEPAVAPD